MSNSQHTELELKLLKENESLKKQVAEQAERIAEQAERIAEQAERIAEQAERISELEKHLAVYENAHAPPSMTGIHLSSVGGNKKRGKSGRKAGHEGSGRKTPDIIHKRKKVKLKACPHCGSRIARKSSRKRTVTDIEPGKAVNTEYDVPRGKCKKCGKIVEPVVVEALPNSRFGLQFALYVAFLSVLGITLSKIAIILVHDYNLKVSKATISNTIEQLAGFLGEDYEKLRLQLLEQKELFADETSHPVNGKNSWLWTFIGRTVAYLKVDKSRGQKVVSEVIGKEFKGIMHSDFWSAYNKLKCDKQKCLAHLKRELKYLKKKSKSKELNTYCSKLLRLLDYARNDNRETREFRTFCEQRLHSIIDQKYADKDCGRLNKRLRRHADEIFTFVDTGAEITNNNAERSLRPQVIKRKNTYGSHSHEGAQAHAIMASFYQTSQLQNQEFRQYMQELVEKQLNSRTEN